MDFLIISKHGIRENINLSAIERELGKSDLSFGDLLDYLKEKKSILMELSRHGDLIFQYINRDGDLVTLRSADRIKIRIAGDTTLFLNVDSIMHVVRPRTETGTIYDHPRVVIEPTPSHFKAWLIVTVVIIIIVLIAMKEKENRLAREKAIEAAISAISSKLPGKWHGKVGSKKAVLFIAQNGRQLSGQILYDGIDEKLSVEIKGNSQIVLKGTGYQRISGKGSFALDNFYGRLSNDSSYITGNYIDAARRQGNWSASKVSKNISEPEPFSQELYKTAEQLEHEKRERNSAFIEAAMKGDTETVKSLLEKGVDMNTQDYNDRTALMIAARDGNIDIVKALLAKGVDVNYKNRWDSTALSWAKRSGYTEIIQLIEEAVKAAGGTQTQTGQVVIPPSTQPLSPKIHLSHSSLDFGEIRVRTNGYKNPDRERTIHISNAGDADLVISKVTSPSFPFEIFRNDCIGNIKSHGRCRIDVKTSLSNSQASTDTDLVDSYKDKLEIHSNDGISTVNLYARVKYEKAPIREYSDQLSWKIKRITGEVKAIDTKAKSITVTKELRGEVKEITANVTDETKITMDREKKTLAAMSTGDKVIMKYKEYNDMRVAKSITIKSSLKNMQSYEIESSSTRTKSDGWKKARENITYEDNQ